MQNQWKSLVLSGAVAVGALALVGCADEVTGTPGGACEIDADCPIDYICHDVEKICVLTGGDLDGEGDPDGDGTGGDGDGTGGDGDGTGGDGDGTGGDGDGTGGDGGDDDWGDGDGDRRTDRPFDPNCEFVDRDTNFTPDEKWFFEVEPWMDYATYDGPTHTGNSMNQVMMTPVVVNLTDDNGDGVVNENDIPDVVFTTFATNESSTTWDQLVTGVLRAVSGDDGSLHWSVGYQELSQHLGISESQWRPQLGFMPAGSIAAGDINNSGTPEIIAPLWDYNNGMEGFAAIRNDGTILWISDEVAPEDLSNWWGGPSIADLNGDGNPEIIVGPVVYDNMGNLLWDGREAPGLVDPNVTGSNYSGASPHIQIGPLSVVADVNREIDPNTGGFTQEVITGRAVFRHDGTLLWEADPELGDGFPAVADFNGNGEAEIVVVSAGTVRIHDGATGDLVWGPVDVPSAGRLGPPTIANMTGQADGEEPRLEIGVAGRNGYFVLRVDYGLPGYNPTPSYNEVLVWEQGTQDVSSNTTGSSVFDFNGDGVASVIYNDETHLRIFNGADGTIQFEAENPSFTALENPVIADVNNDGAANIIVAASDFECGVEISGCQKGMAGVRVFGDANDNWVATRRIWNQHAYSITNVNEDGSIPADPTPNYLAHNTFRLNTMSEILPQAAPDLLPENPRVINEACIYLLEVWVTNSGAIQVGPGIPVSLYAEQGTSRELLGTAQTTGGLQPGESEMVSIDAFIPSGTTWDIVVVVDDVDGESTRNECNEENNRLVVTQGFSC